MLQYCVAVVFCSGVLQQCVDVMLQLCVAAVCCSGVFQQCVAQLNQGPPLHRATAPPRQSIYSDVTSHMIDSRHT